MINSHNSYKSLIKKGIALLLAFILAIGGGIQAGGKAQAAPVAVLDQVQDTTSFYASSLVSARDWVPQTFTPDLTGDLTQVEIWVFKYNEPGKIFARVYDDSSRLLGTAEVESASGWVSFDFSASPPYLVKDRMYRLEVITEYGTDGNAGVNWYYHSDDPYSRGYGINPDTRMDFAFRTYMIPDTSISLSDSELSASDDGLTADGISETEVTVTLMDMQGDVPAAGGEAVVVSSSLGTVGAVTDNGNGTYAATLKAPTTTGTATVSATVGGRELEQTATVEFVAGEVSPDESAIEVGDYELIADGTSTTTITVTLRDSRGNAQSSGGETVLILTSRGTIGPVTDNGDGTYTATLTSSATLGTARVSATVGGVELGGTEYVEFIPGDISEDVSTIAAEDEELTADGTSETTISVTVKDALGHVISLPLPVSMSTTAGTLGEVRGDERGTYTATLKAPSTVGTATVSATVDGTELSQTATVEFVVGDMSPDGSTIEAEDDQLIADGTSTTTITVTLRDSRGNALSSGGETVLMTTSRGTIGPVTDNGDGTYSATLTSSTTLGTAEVRATVGGVELGGMEFVDFVPGDISEPVSTIGAVDEELTADGTSETTISVTVKDALGHAIRRPMPVRMSTTAGTLGEVRGNERGTYTATLRAPTTAGTATVSATADGIELSQTATVEFVAGEVSPDGSTIEAEEDLLVADGTSTTTITVTLRDSHGNAQSSGGATVRMSTTAGTLGAVEDNGDGTYAATLTSSTTLDTAEVSATVGGAELAATVYVDFVPGELSQEVSTVAAAAESLTANGTSTTMISITVKDALGHAIPRPASVVLTTTAGTLGVVRGDERGTYTATLTAPTTPGTATVSVTVDGVELAQTATVVFTPRNVSSNANLSEWRLEGLSPAPAFVFDPAKTEYDLEVDNSTEEFRMRLKPEDSTSVIEVNGTRVTNDTLTGEYELAPGSNVFQIRVQAEDGSSRTYVLNINRAGTSGPVDPGEPEPSPTPDPTQVNDPSSPVWINGKPLGSIAKILLNGNGVKTMEIEITASTARIVIEALQGSPDMSVSVKDLAEEYVLVIRGDALALLRESASTIELDSPIGKFRLPLSELADEKADWTSGDEARISIGRGDEAERQSLLEAADRDGFRLAGDPIRYRVRLLDSSGSREVTEFGSYTRKVIYPATEDSGTATAAVFLDPDRGILPATAEFIPVDGRSAAVIRSLGNGLFAPVHRSVFFSDMEGHWAAPDVSSLAGRLIANGVDAGRFSPETPVTRAQLAALLARALGLADRDGTGAGVFRDVGSYSWYSGSVAALYRQGILGGFGDGTFGPDRIVSRQEAIVTIVRALRWAGEEAAVASGAPADLTRFSDSDRVAAWAREAMQTAIGLGLVEGDGGRLLPEKSLTRAETIALLRRMLVTSGLIDG